MSSSLGNFYLGNFMHNVAGGTKKSRLRRSRWPKACCIKCGAIRWGKAGSKVCHKCYGFCWLVPNLTMGFALLKIDPKKRAVFAKLSYLGGKMT